MSNSKEVSLARRLTAIGFIILIICGNFWFVRLLTASEPGAALMYSAQFGLLLVVSGGLGLLWEKFFAPAPVEIDDEVSEDHEGPKTN